MTQNYTIKPEMPPVTFLGNLCKTYAVLCSKIADVHGIELRDVRTRKFVYFQKIFRLLLHIIRGVTRREQGVIIPQMPIHRGGPRSHIQARIYH